MAKTIKDVVNLSESKVLIERINITEQRQNELIKQMHEAQLKQLKGMHTATDMLTNITEAKLHTMEVITRSCLDYTANIMRDVEYNNETELLFILTVSFDYYRIMCEQMPESILNLIRDRRSIEMIQLNSVLQVVKDTTIN